MTTKFLAATAGLALFVSASQAVAGDVLAMHPFARATAPKAPNGAAFMVLMNQGAQDQALIGASSSVAERVELHAHQNDNGVMKMREVEQVPLPAGEEVILQPGAYHIMLFGLQAPLKQGESLTVTLEFANGSDLSVLVPIKSAGAMMDMDHEAAGHEDTHLPMGSSTKGHDSKFKSVENPSGSGSKSN